MEGNLNRLASTCIPSSLPMFNSMPINFKIWQICWKMCISKADTRDDWWARVTKIRQTDKNYELRPPESSRTRSSYEQTLSQGVEINVLHDLFHVKNGNLSICFIIPPFAFFYPIFQHLFILLAFYTQLTSYSIKLAASQKLFKNSFCFWEAFNRPWNMFIDKK